VTWQDPYGQQPGRQDPYAQQQGYGYGPPGGPPSGASNGAAIGALIANIVAALFCCAGIAWLPGIILSAIAINRTQQNPESARNLTVWAWVCFALNAVISVALIVILQVTGVFTMRNF
jgi:hypothetical protein